jgi:hypothetical protein
LTYVVTFCTFVSYLKKTIKNSQMKTSILSVTLEAVALEAMAVVALVEDDMLYRVSDIIAK